ncbi:MAG: phosphatidate cytidylyltransferase [Pseudomonadota bacterium]
MQRSDEARSGAAWPRILSAVALALLGAAAVYGGWPWFHALAAAGAGVMAWEWSRICVGRFNSTGIVLVVSILLIIIPAIFARYDLALALTLLGAIAVLVLASLAGVRSPAWFAAGAIYIGLPLVAILWLYGVTAAGRNTVVWLLVTVVATDVGAYYSGRTIGGPRLAPRISPGKTWSGLAGGMICAAAAGALCADLVGGPSLWLAAAAGATVAVVAQAGDLLESRVKRRFDIKDSSDIIPGHGGLLDRMDGLVAAVTIFGGLQWIIGARLLTWQPL